MSQPPKQTPPPRRGGFATLDSIRNQKPDGQSYFVGGGGTGGGGVEVYDPRKEGGGPDVAGRIVDLAHKQTREEGAAFNLKNAHKIILYKNGFIVDDGPLRAYDAPENAAFLASIQRGETPRELMAAPGETVDVDLQDSRGELYSPPGAAAAAATPAFVPFSGEGQKLAAEGATGAIPPDPHAQAPTVNEAAPVTTLQVRLLDGRRIAVKLNHTHTVGDLRRAIDAQCPTGAPYRLALAFPRKSLDNLGATLAAEGLVGAVVQQMP